MDLNIFKVVNFASVMNFSIFFITGILGFLGEGYFKGQIGVHPEITAQLIQCKRVCSYLKAVSTIFLQITFISILLVIVLYTIKFLNHK